MLLRRGRAPARIVRSGALGAPSLSALQAFATPQRPAAATSLPRLYVTLTLRRPQGEECATIAPYVTLSLSKGAPQFSRRACASSRMAFQSPRTNAPFFARDQPLSRFST